MAIVCAWAGPADLAAAEAFVARWFGPGSVQAAAGRFAWLCAAPGDGPQVALAREDETLIAVCCHLPVRLAGAGGGDVAAAYGLDFLVAPDRRGKGLGERVLALRLERFAASVSTGQSPAMSALYRKAGAAVAARFFSALAVRRLRPAGGPKALARDAVAWALGWRRLGARGAAARAGGAAAGSAAPAAAGAALAARREIDAEAAAALLGALPDRLTPGEAGPRTDAARLRWRYAGPVYHDYRFWALAGRGGASGLLVSRFAGGDTGAGAGRGAGERGAGGPGGRSAGPAAEVIVDLYGAAEELPALLGVAAATSPAARLTAVAAGQRLAAAFRAAGFLVRPTAAELVVISDRPGVQADLAARDWLVLAGEADADLLRRPAAAGA